MHEQWLLAMPLACLVLALSSAFPQVAHSEIVTAGGWYDIDNEETAFLHLHARVHTLRSKREIGRSNLPCFGESNLSDVYHHAVQEVSLLGRSQGCDATTAFSPRRTRNPPSFAYSVSTENLTEGSSALYGEAVAYLGKVYAAPHNAMDLLVYDTARDIAWTIPTAPILDFPHEYVCHWLGITAYEGKIYAAPADESNLLVYDVELQVLSGVPTSSIASIASPYPGSSDGKWNGVAGFNGMVYAAPMNAEAMLVYDLAAHAVSGVSTTSVCSGFGKWMGLVEHSGKLYSAPIDILGGQCDQMLVYDTALGVVSGISTAGVATGPWKWHGMAVLGDTIYAVPANVDAILMYDVKTSVVSGASTKMLAQGEHKWAGLTAHRGKLYGGPQLHSSVLVYDPEATNASTYSLEPEAGDSEVCQSWNGIAAVGDRLYCDPYEGNSFLVYRLP